MLATAPAKLAERPHSNGQISIAGRGPLQELALVRRPTFIMGSYFMASAGKNVPKKSRGRPATGKGTQVGERWPSRAIEQIDEWRHQQLDLPGRPEAIRRLVEIGLKAKGD
jgi:hypothetical protein